MRLFDLEPHWISDGGRHGLGFTFKCPHCETQLTIWLENPLDEGPSVNSSRHSGPMVWRTGDSFSDLSLSPSIFVADHWSGSIREGNVTIAEVSIGRA